MKKSKRRIEDETEDIYSRYEFWLYKAEVYEKKGKTSDYYLALKKAEYYKNLIKRNGETDED